VEAAEREEHFRRIFQSEYRHVLAYALRRTGDLAEAQDAVAEVFTVAWRRFADAPADEATRPWLFAIARRTIANQRRSQRRRLAVRERLHLQPSTPRGTEEILDDRQGLRAVLAALARLSPDEQEVLRLAVWEDLSNREIGIVLGCSENAAAIRLHRARRRLSEESLKEDVSTGH
jgi:RNA polymerase sigma-70 factor (ECF subfamily)